MSTMIDNKALSRSKSSLFSEEDILFAELCKALSHPARIAIIRELAKRGECICGEIVQGIPLAQSTVSQHLKKLLEVGIIQGEIEGTKSCYCLNPKVLAKFGRIFEKLLAKVERGPPTC